MKKLISTLTLTMTLLSSSLIGNAKSQDLIYLGSWHSEVPSIQKILGQKGYFNHEITGYYGEITKNAVTRFQRDSGIKADGIVGPVTRGKLYTTYSEEDVYWLSRIVHAEAEGESYEGKVAVADCVLNRVKSNDFPNSVYSVIFDRKYGVQYQPTANGRIYNTPGAESVNAAKAALGGYNNVGKSLYFYNPKKSTNNWIANNRPYYKSIGNHNFHI